MGGFQSTPAPGSCVAGYAIYSGQKYGMQCGVDYAGGDYQQVQFDNYMDFLQACAVDPTCTDASFAQQSDVCFLKSTLATPQGKTYIDAAVCAVAQVATSSSGALGTFTVTIISLSSNLSSYTITTTIEQTTMATSTSAETTAVSTTFGATVTATSTLTSAVTTTAVSTATVEDTITTTTTHEDTTTSVSTLTYEDTVTIAITQNYTTTMTVTVTATTTLDDTITITRMVTSTTSSSSVAPATSYPVSSYSACTFRTTLTLYAGTVFTPYYVVPTACYDPAIASLLVSRYSARTVFPSTTSSIPPSTPTVFAGSSIAPYIISTVTISSTTTSSFFWQAFEVQATAAVQGEKWAGTKNNHPVALNYDAMHLNQTSPQMLCAKQYSVPGLL